MAGAVAGGIAQGGMALLNALGLFVITPFVTYYMMKEWPRITKWVTDLIPRPHQHDILGIFHDIDRKLSGFIRGQALVALFLGVAYALALSVAGLNYGFMIGLFSGFLSIIPMVGSVTGFVVGVLVAIKIKAKDGKSAVRGMAHITGGGLYENIPRVLPDDVCAHLDARAWNFLPVFRWLAKAGQIQPADMARTLNCGIGLVVVVTPDEAEAVKKSFETGGETVYTIGKITKRADAPVVIDNLADWA